MLAPKNLDATFGQIDIYLFDQILRGRLARGSRVLDAGCGGGRNIQYLLDAQYDVFAVDEDPEAIGQVMRMAAHLNPALSPTNFRREAIDNMSFADAWFDAVLSIAVLHFAKDDDQFGDMLQSMWRVLRPGGVFFCRLASNIGMESRMKAVNGRRFLLPDGTERYLVDEGLLKDWTSRLSARMLDPIKTTIVQDQRCMTTWVLRKNDG